MIDPRDGIFLGVNGSDIAKAILMGHHPHLDPGGFTKVMRRIEGVRNREDDELRARNMTKSRGYRLSRKWADAESMLCETGFKAPTWLGCGVGVEEWVRGETDPLFVFRPNDEVRSIMVFGRRASGRWIRLL